MSGYGRRQTWLVFRQGGMAAGDRGGVGRSLAIGMVLIC